MTVIGDWNRRARLTHVQFKGDTMPTSADIIASTNNQDYDQCRERNDDLTVLAKGVATVFADMGLTPSSATVLKEAIVSAYLLGRRDAVSVPSVFES